MAISGLEKSLDNLRKMSFGLHCLYQALSGGTLVCFPEDISTPGLNAKGSLILHLRIYIVILQPS